MKVSKCFSFFFLIGALAAPLTRAGSYSAPVQVTNPDSSPVPVRVITNAARTPFQIALYITKTTVWPSFQVPLNKRLVLEEITSQRYPDSRPYTGTVSLGTVVGGVTVWHSFGYSPTVDGSFWAFDKVVKLYADPGTLVTANIGNGVSGASESATVTFVGYFEDPN